MFQVQCLQATQEKKTELYSKYFIGPFIKGQSTTLGNTLRRVLLSNLQGLAIVGVRINGINHEFSTITSVKEDVIDILLNLKQIVLKGSITEPTLGRLRVNESGIITAGDIELPNRLEVVEPLQYIATLTANGGLDMEFLIAKGQNYYKNNSIDYILPSGFLGVDAIFMPVKKVNFFVETSQINPSADLESLILEVWTNGSITPAQAISYSAEILENVFHQFKISDSKSPITDTIEPNLKGEEFTEQLDKILIEELELSVRAYNCLKRANIHNLAELLSYSIKDLLEFKNFGQKSADEVAESLKERFYMHLPK